MTRTYTTRPLTDYTWMRPVDERKTSPFSSSWSDTLEQFRVELDHLEGRDVVLELDIKAASIRPDGMPKTDARVESPGVIVAFESKHGPMVYRSDRFWGRYGLSRSRAWQENVRAVVATLDRLRAVDRYGATQTGQQYTGFKAIGAGPSSATAMPAAMTRAEAKTVLAGVVGAFDYSEGAERVRRARAMSHPDRNNGDRTLWDQVEQAAQALGLG